MAILMTEDGPAGEIPEEWVSELLAKGYVEQMPDGHIVISQAGRDYLRLTTGKTQ